MDERLLQQFTNDPHTRNEVLNFIVSYINSEAINMIYSKQDVSGIADAKKLIEGAFDNLITQYGIKAKAQKSVNEAR